LTQGHKESVPASHITSTFRISVRPKI